MADMLRVLEQNSALIKQTETKIHEAQKTKEALEQQEEQELGKKAALAEELQSLHNSYMGAVAQRTQLEAEQQAVRDQNEALKQDIAEALAAVVASKEASRERKDAFTLECMELEARIKAARTHQDRDVIVS